MKSYTLTTLTDRSQVTTTLTTATDIRDPQFDREVRQAVNAAAGGRRWIVARISNANGWNLGETFYRDEEVAS